MTQFRKNLTLILLAVTLLAGLVVAQQRADEATVTTSSTGAADGTQDATEQPDEPESQNKLKTDQSTGAAPAATDTDADESRVAAEESEEKEPAPGLISKATMEEFVPSEEISDDRSVSYPNDI